MTESFDQALPQEHSHFNSELIFTKERNEVLLNILPNTLGLKKLEVFAREHTLYPKSEFHVTLIGGKTSESISKTLNEMSQDRLFLRGKVEDLMRNFKWQVLPKEVFYYLRRNYNDPDLNDLNKMIPEIRETVIQMVDIPQLQSFHNDICKLFGIQDKIESLPHVTLYTNSTRQDKKQRGIGIYSEEDLIMSNARKISI